MKSKRYLIPFFLSFLCGIAIFFLWIKREEAKKRTTTPQVLEVSHTEKEYKEEEGKSEETIWPIGVSAEPTIEEPTVMPTTVKLKEEIDDDMILSDNNIKGVRPPPTHLYYQPSSDDPEKTVKAFLEAAKKGDPANFQYFLNSEARRNTDIHLVPVDWDGNLGAAIIEEKMKGDANTIKVIVAFYEGQNLSLTPIERIGYFLVKSFEKWLIFDTVLEKE